MSFAMLAPGMYLLIIAHARSVPQVFPPRLNTKPIPTPIKTPL